MKDYRNVPKHCRQIEEKLDKVASADIEPKLELPELVAISTGQ